MTRQAVTAGVLAGEHATPLPRGPHRLSREQVAASQRARLVTATADLVAAEGYASCTVSAICRRAGISPRSFYECFDGKLACYLAAYERFAEGLLERMAAAVEPQAEWEAFIDSTLDSYLGALEADRLAARAFLIEGDAAGPAARLLRREALGRFAALLQLRHEQIRAAQPELAPLPPAVHLGFVHGVRALACEAIETGEPADLRDLAPVVRNWLQATVLGAAAASA